MAGKRVYGLKLLGEFFGRGRHSQQPAKVRENATSEPRHGLGYANGQGQRSRLPKGVICLGCLAPSGGGRLGRGRGPPAAARQPSSAN